MKSRLVASLAALTLLLLPSALRAADPLRVFIRGGVKTHGPGQHDHPRFLGDWTKLLGERGLKVDGGMEFPAAAQLDNTDVVIIYAADGMKITGDQRANFEKFLKRGGGLVVIHDGVVSGDQHEWAKKVQGGAWRWDLAPDKRTKWFEGEVGVYFVNPEHPIVRGVSNFDWKDEIYYELDMAPDVKVLATSFHSVFVVAPQLWTYEKTWDGGTAPYRAFVSLPGHEYVIFNTPHYRALLLRGIAWAGKRANPDEFCRPEELASLKYPEGGPTAPEKAAARFNVHPEFNVNLVAAEPLIEKAISLDWDSQGRLWVAEMPEYPGGRTINTNDQMVALWASENPEKVPPGGKESRPARDRISRLEDTDGDGRMDRKHIFADFEHGVPGGLELVTSLVFHKDGVIVSQAPDILWLRDTNGDGVCDQVEKLYTGFGTFDTHAVLNNFRWGLDGWIYSAIGYSAGDPTSPDGTKRFGRVTAGIIRFKPDGSTVEQVASGSCNTWGCDFAPDGELLYTTATCGEHFLHVVMPEKVLARGNVGGVRASAVIPDHQRIFPSVHHTRPAYVQIDWVGQFTASAGSCVYNGGAWPERFNGSHFSSETTMSLVHHEFLRPNGVTYVATKETGREETEFIAGTDLWFRPVHARVGPDGALYVIDFYNQAAIHNDTRGPKHGARNAAVRPDRDHHFGRIWRVQHKQAKALDTPKLQGLAAAQLISSLNHPNGWTRDTAARLLREKGIGDQIEALQNLIRATDRSAYARIAALYTAEALGELEGDLLLAAIGDASPIVRKNALRVASERDNTGFVPEVAGLQSLLADPDGRVRLNALIAVATCDLSPEVADAVVKAWPTFKDKHLQSAAVAVAARDPLLFLTQTFQVAIGAPAADAAEYPAFVRHIVRQVANRRDAAATSRLVVHVSGGAPGADPLKQAALETLAANLGSSESPEWTPELQAAFKSLLSSPQPGLPGAALPLIAPWDKGGTLAADVRTAAGRLIERLNDTSLPDDQRAQVAANLLGVRRMDPQVVPRVTGLIGSAASPALQKQVIEALGATGEMPAAQAMLAAYPKVSDELRETIFGQVVRRADWSQLLVQLVSEKKIDLALLGPVNVHRLRTHSDAKVAANARQVVDGLRGPEQKEKDELIAKFRPEVIKAGNLENGHRLFTQNCGVCHKYKEEGSDLAPNLTGMGAHGPEDLLMHILDPNRVVEPNFLAVSIETADDLIYDGIVTRENPAAVFIRNQTGEVEVRKSNIRSRRLTDLSLMPSGFEALGADGLRDLVGYLCADESRFRILDLRDAFTANTSRGIFNSAEAREETLRFKRFGTLKVDEVPFDIISPQRSPSGNNVIVLKGGAGLARSYPQKVEVKVGMALSKLHFLGGVGGWAYPCCGDNKHEGLNVAKVTLRFAGGATEEMVFKNGVEFADYVAKFDVPGSTEVPDLCHNGRQVRWFSREVKGRGVVQSLAIESFDNFVAPAFIGITAELAAPAAGSSTAGLPSTGAGSPGSRVLIVGGGTHHDFDRWFNLEDVKTLGAGAKYTDQPAAILPALKELDVLYLSNNQPLKDPDLRKAIFGFAESGKGLMLVHPALWYNWADWPEYNRVLAGGGSRAHDPFGEFEVTVTQPDHPLVKGLPAKFTIADELYYFEPDPQGTPIKVLATAFSKQKNKTYPQVFVVEHPKTRIAGITLGHDGKAHEHPAFKTLLQNTVRWAAGK